MKNMLKGILNILFGPYEIYEIYRSKSSGEVVQEVQLVTVEQLNDSPYEEVKRLADYAAKDAEFFGFFDQGEIAAACCFWCGDTYRNRRGFIELPEGSAKLVQIVTAKEMRGKRLASRLIAGSTAIMAGRKIAPLFARIWRGHRASAKAFENAGWVKEKTITQFHFLWKKRRITF